MTEAANGNLAIKKQNLYLTIHEATGLSKDDTPIWDDDFTEGYVRGIFIHYKKLKIKEKSKQKI